VIIRLAAADVPTPDLRPERDRDSSRTSFGTWCSDVAHDVTFEVAEACLSHRVGSAVSRAYNRSDMFERRRPVMAQWAAYLDGETETAAKVVSIGARRKRP
jgi:hypothetical protein